MKRLLSSLRFIVGLIVPLGLSVAIANGCGVSWTTPQDHFNGVNEYGAVSYWEQLATIDLGNGLQIPLVMGFQSDREQSSPYLGKGWILALLDSNVVQTDDNNFTMIQPDGWTVNFWRANPTDKVLGGQGGWQAQIDGDTITAWAECGWRLTYTKGKLTSIGTPQNKSLELIYVDGKVSRIMYGSEAVLEVNTESNSGMVTGLRLNNQNFQLEQGNKPYIQTINGQSLIGQIDQALDKITLPDGTVKSYKFGTNDKLQPNLKIDDRLITWDPSTKHILQDNDWTYKITPNDPGNASIVRTSKSGQNELWFYNPSLGENATKNGDGPEIVTQQFTSGLLAGKLRQRSEIDSLGVITVAYQVSYDERGRVIRERFHKSNEYNFDRTISYQYYDDGNCMITINENQKNRSRTYDSKGLLVSESLISSQ